MIRQHLKIASGKNEQSLFRNRGVDNTRIEALSDGVFAIAIALLLISTSVPEKFSELVIFLHDFVPFTFTIALLMVIWYQHYLFFLRYGLKDSVTVALNTLFLILILYYVYPLKFLFKTLYILFSALFRNDTEQLQDLFTNVLSREDGTSLMVIYGVGVALIFLTMATLYGYAYIKKENLSLNEIEEFDTKLSINQNILMAIVPLISTMIAYFKLAGNTSFSVSGMFYMIYVIVMPTYGIIVGKKRARLIQKINDNQE